MVAVQETALEIPDRASTPFTSYQAMVTVLAAAVDDDGRTEAETGHLHALCAAMLFFRQPDGTFLGTYREARPLAAPGGPAPARGPRPLVRLR